MTKGQHSFQLSGPQDFVSVRKALATIKSDFLRQGHLAEQYASVEMVFAEALNNIAEHGGPTVHLSPIKIKWQFMQGLFQAELEDGGQPFAPKTLSKKPAPNLDVVEADLPEGGFGWHIMSQLCDRLDYQRQDGKNLLLIALHPEACR